MSISSKGLLTFIVVVAVDATALLVDLVMILSGTPTITSWVTAHPWSIVLPVLWQIVGAVGLLIHFVAYRRATRNTHRSQPSRPAGRHRSPSDPRDA